MRSRFLISCCVLVLASFAQQARANPLYSASAFIDGESTTYASENFNDELAPVTASVNHVVPAGTTASASGSSSLYAVTSAAAVTSGVDVSEQLTSTGDSNFIFTIGAGDLPSLFGTFSITATYDISVLSLGPDAAATGYAFLTGFDAFGNFDTDDVVIVDNGAGIGTLSIEFTGDFSDGVTIQLSSYSDATGGTSQFGEPTTGLANSSLIVTSILLNDIELIDIVPAPIPEPSSLALLLLGGVGMFAFGRKRMRRVVQVANEGVKS